ncbi:MAG: hypothetical protein HRU19_06865 [Pseudobacteriovorax sp.]|nr:hypothetical protein [Pseudobacteriovorax sp.]
MKQLCLVVSFVMVFVVSACKGEDDATTSQQILRDQVWSHIQFTESEASYKERLSPSLLALHTSNSNVLQNKIPENYPEPYLPYGQLVDRNIDPGLAYQPFLSQELIELGERLFFDPVLSFSPSPDRDGTVSCSSCHAMDKAFSDDRSLSVGIEGDKTRHNSPSLINVGYQSNLTWSPLFLPILEKQAEIPLFGDDPIEMGLRGKELVLQERLRDSAEDYDSLFSAAFPQQELLWLDAPLFNYDAITLALGAYQRSLIQFDSPFDQWLVGDDGALTETQRMGLELFFGFRQLESGVSMNCSDCHAGFMLSDSFQYVRGDEFYWNQEFYISDLSGPDGFKAPSLRQISLTAPYGAFGNMLDLSQVIEFYASGKRHNLDGFVVDDREKQLLESFLEAL